MRLKSRDPPQKAHLGSQLNVHSLFFKFLPEFRGSYTRNKRKKLEKATKKQHIGACEGMQWGRKVEPLKSTYTVSTECT